MAFSLSYSSFAATIAIAIVIDCALTQKLFPFVHANSEINRARIYIYALWELCSGGGRWICFTVIFASYKCHVPCTVHIKNEISFGTALQCHHLRHSAEYLVFLDTFSTCFKRLVVGCFISRPLFAAAIFLPFAFSLFHTEQNAANPFLFDTIFCLFFPRNCPHNERKNRNERRKKYHTPYRNGKIISKRVRKKQ